MMDLLLRPGAAVISVSDGVLTVGLDDRRFALEGVTGLEPVLSLLGGGRVGLRELIGSLGNARGDSPTARARRLSKVLEMLAGRGIVEFRCSWNGTDLLSATGTGLLCSFDLTSRLAGQAPDLDGLGHDDNQAFQLSRFACARRLDGEFVIECPHRSVRISVLVPDGAALAAALVIPASPAELAKRLPSLAPVLGAAIDFLVSAGAAAPVTPDGGLPEDDDPVLRTREFHDVLLHAQSRYGLTDRALGGTFRFAGQIPPPSALKPRASGGIRLPCPDLGDLEQTDLPLVTTMEQRRTIRTHGAALLTAAQLGEFLFRVARVRSVRPPDPNDDQSYETTSRTYPSGGATYDLEIYPLIRESDGIPFGLYRYEPVSHELCPVGAPRGIADAILRNAWTANGCHAVPPVLLIIASRFTRLSWKYSGIAYATTLRNVGVLYEAMYLTATAMRLAPCALGCGNSALFSVATGLDPMHESSVGEFMLGPRPEEEVSQSGPPD
jgi:SagB-type dehydrogenase family enzyme